LHAYLFRFLSSQDATFQHIAVWTMVQFLESGGNLLVYYDPATPTDYRRDPQLISSIRNSQSLMSRVQQLAQSPVTSRTSSIRSGRSQTQAYDDPDAAEGQGEIAILARRIQDMVDGEEGLLQTGAVGGYAVGSEVSGSFQESAYRSSREQGREHDELRKSLTDAFSGQ
jgi:vacuolar protein 8